MLSINMDVNKYMADVMEYNGKMIEIRRKIHENPELSYSEFQTAKLIAETLKSFNIEVKENVGGTGVIGLLRGTEGKTTIGLRSDMDALPVTEETGVEYASKNKGIMHACGHDTHVAMLLCAAYVLSKHRNGLKGNIKFLFQPAEEDGGRGGALPMIEDGALEDPHVDHVFGLHVVNDFPAGTIALKAGPEMACPDSLKIILHGRGGHGSDPANTIDPIFIGTQIINAIYGIRSRYIDQREPVTISICSLHSGTKDNIIPDDLIMEGTIRTFNENIRLKIKKSINDMVKSISLAYGATAEISFKNDAYPVTYNDPEITGEVIKLLSGIRGIKVVDSGLLLGGEDVSRFLDKAPGTYYLLGTKNDAKGLIYSNHSSKFNVDEDYLKFGSLTHVDVAMYFANK